MDATVAGLVGTFVGGFITFGVTWLNRKKDLELKRLELDAQHSQAQLAEKTRDRDRCLDKYAEFLGAYRKLDGFVVDIINLLHARRGDWREAIRKTLDSAAFSEAIKQLNEGTAWVGLLCHQEQGFKQALRLSDAYDRLEKQLCLIAGNDSVSPDETLEARRRDVISSFEKLFETLRKEVFNG
jgi:hypothetical protein